jgi:glycosyltransferase involved in cell wall biosynthesis
MKIFKQEKQGMKVVLIGLAHAFTEGMTYQENLLADQLKADGNDVVIISECYTYQNGVVVKTCEEDRYLSNGIRLIRLKYRNILGEFVTRKVRAVKGLYNILEKERPDIIFNHDLHSVELLTVARYKKNHPHVKLYIDNHGDFNNSATNFLSKYVLHKIFYRVIIKLALPYADKIFNVAYECFDFLKQLYDIPDEKMELYPLGGIVFEETVRKEKRERIRKELGLKESDILAVHSGKMDKLKRTEDILKAFLQVPGDRLKLVIIGSIKDDVRENILPLISSDKRITFLGWKSGHELMEYLCACDLYVQPGSQSATMQNALCCGSAAALYPHKSHKLLLGDSVFYVETIDDMKNLFTEILKNPEILENKRAQSNDIARRMLDYKILASRLYRGMA